LAFLAFKPFFAPEKHKINPKLKEKAELLSNEETRRLLGLWSHKVATQL
jgi:hypothetical protein